MESSFRSIGTKVGRSALAAAVAATCMGMPTLATAGTAGDIPNGNISIARTTHNTATTYKAYQIFKGFVDSQDRVKHIELADGVTASAAAMAEKLNSIGTGNPYDTWLAANSKGTGTGATAADRVTQADRENAQNMLEYISAAITSSHASRNNAESLPIVDAETFASTFAKWADDNATAQTVTPGTALTTQEGYYLIVTDADSIETNGAGTAPIWTSVGGSVESITEKVSAPTVNKQVKDDASAAWKDAGKGEVADAEVYQDMDFKLTGTLPADLPAYSVYHYKFEDTLSAGLDMKAANSADDPDAAGDISSVVVKVDGEDVTGQLRSSAYNTAIGSAPATATDKSSTGAKGSISYASNKLVVDITDLKQLTLANAPTADSTVTVEYKAHMTKSDNVVTGATGNSNTVTLAYTKDPMPDSHGDYPDGITTGESSKLMTYKLTVDKVDSNNNVKLAGHKFVIRNSDDKYLATDGSWTGTWAPEPASADGGTASVAGGGNSNLSGYTETVPDGKIGAQVLATDANGALTFKGLDEGTYTIKEVYAPDPYAALAEVTVQVTSNVDALASGTTDTLALTKSVVGTYITMAQPTIDATRSNDEAGEIVVTIPNDRMVTVPLTGEQGTALVLLLGSAILAASVAAKRRNAKRGDEAGATAAAA